MDKPPFKVSVVLKAKIKAKPVPTPPATKPKPKPKLTNYVPDFSDYFY